MRVIPDDRNATHPRFPDILLHSAPRWAVLRPPPPDDGFARRACRAYDRGWLAINAVAAAVAPSFTLTPGGKHLLSQAGCVAVWLACAAWLAAAVVAVFRRRAGRRPHPALRRLAKLGPLDQVVAAVEAEWAAATPADRDRGVLASWLIVPAFLGYHVRPLTEVVWAYRRERTVNGAEAGQFAVVHLRDGTVLQHDFGNADGADAFLRLLATRVPAAFYGYTDELVRAATRDFGGLVAAVDGRRFGGPPSNDPAL